MRAPVIERRFHDSSPVAKLNRRLLGDAGVFAVSVSGGPGCGKTSLIDATLRLLMPEIHVGVIACDVSTHLDGDRMSRGSEQVVQVNTGDTGMPDATHIHDALEWLDLKWIDVLFIENVGTLVGPTWLDLGQEAAVTIFSVAGGHDKAEKHPDLVKSANVIVLSKTDLLPAVPFSQELFRADVKRLNPQAELFELSALRGQGMDRWTHWLKERVRKGSEKSAAWFG